MSAVFCWRGIWLLWDLTPLNPILQGVIAHIIGVTLTSILYTFRSVIAPPGIIMHDTKQEQFSIHIWSITNRYNRVTLDTTSQV